MKAWVSVLQPCFCARSQNFPSSVWHFIRPNTIQIAPLTLRTWQLFLLLFLFYWLNYHCKMKRSIKPVRHPDKNTTHWQEWVLIYLFFLLAKKKRNLNKGFMKRTKAKPRTNTQRFGPHFFLLASQLPFTVPTCTSQGSRQARPERDANLSWHIKLRLARITELTATNGQAERLSSRAEGPHQIRLPAGACDLGGVHHVVAYWREC